MLPQANDLYNTYIKRYCEAKQITKDEAESHLLVKYIKRMYDKYDNDDIQGSNKVPDYSKRNLDE